MYRHQTSTSVHRDGDVGRSTITDIVFDILLLDLEKAVSLPQWCAIQIHEDSSHGMNMSGKTYSFKVLKRLKT